MDIESFKQNFSMPLGGPMYAAPPYPFRGVQDLMIRYEADGAAVSELLPPIWSPPTIRRSARRGRAGYRSRPSAPITKPSSWST